tara:strand:- start:47 stop:916 length:870 start_codon:yes stop_codon:yes gene_type:complete
VNESKKYISPLKLNLYLHLINKANDGYHNLESLMTFCDYGDYIYIKKEKDFSFTIDGPFSKNLSKTENIILDAVKLVEKHLKFKINVHIKLTKNIPVASGMGGGSSNAATVIHCLKDLLEFSIEKNSMNSLLFSLGADVPFCFFRTTAIVRGKGEKIEFLSSEIPEFPVLLINPLIEVSTKKIFESTKLFNEKRKDCDVDFFNPDLFLEGLNKKNNDLEGVAERICPIIKKITSFLKAETNSKLVRMTGSGATCFGLFDNISDLNQADILINSMFKEIWTKKTKIINKI